MDTILLVSRIEVFFAAALSLTAVVLYAIYSPAWRKTGFGKTLFAVIAMISFSFVVTAVTIVAGLSPWVIAMRAIAYFVLCVALFILCTAIVVIQERAYLEYVASVEKRKTNKEALDGQVDQEPREP